MDRFPQRTVAAGWLGSDLGRNSSRRSGVEPVFPFRVPNPQETRGKLGNRETKHGGHLLPAMERTGLVACPWLLVLPSLFLPCWPGACFAFFFEHRAWAMNATERGNQDGILDLPAGSFIRCCVWWEALDFLGPSPYQEAIGRCPLATLSVPASLKPALQSRKRFHFGYLFLTHCQMLAWHAVLIPTTRT